MKFEGKELLDPFMTSESNEEGGRTFSPLRFGNITRLDFADNILEKEDSLLQFLINNRRFLGDDTKVMFSFPVKLQNVNTLSYVVMILSNQECAIIHESEIKNVWIEAENRLLDWINEIN